jgi:hypothetical protein
MDKRIVLTAVCVVLTACAGLPGVDTGISRQDLEAKGGKRLAAADLRQSITGALVSGRSPSGRAFVDWALDANGAINGTISTQHGAFSQTGKWNVSEDGKFCYTVNGPPEAGGSFSGCWDWYRLGADLYAVEGTSAMKREVARR